MPSIHTRTRTTASLAPGMRRFRRLRPSSPPRSRNGLHLTGSLPRSITMSRTQCAPALIHADGLLALTIYVPLLAAVGQPPSAEGPSLYVCRQGATALYTAQPTRERPGPLLTLSTRPLRCCTSSVPVTAGPAH